MSAAAVTVTVFVLLAATTSWPAGGSETKAEMLTGPVLLLPGDKAPYRLGLEVVQDGKNPQRNWETFLERLFAHFDRDGDGWLSRAEAARVTPLPLPGGKELAIDFDRLDAEGNGKASLAELKAFCRANGFTPFVVVVTPPSQSDMALAELFQRRLDPSGKGHLTRARLREMPLALRKYDIDDNEYLDLSELLAGVDGSPQRRAEARVKLAGAKDKRNATLRIDLGAKERATLNGGTAGVRLMPPVVKGGAYRLHGPDNGWLTFRASRIAPNMASSRDFLLAQFKTALGDAPALAKADLEQDPALAGFLELLPYADRDGDGKLTPAELRGYLDLVEMGMRAQVWITVADHERNPFNFLDSDGDARLSYREQVAAPDLLGGKAEEKGLPSQIELSFSGPAVKTWGGVLVPREKRPVAQAPDLTGAPRWFRAMDRNGDGVISPREFVGPPEVFRELDTDGDGVISPTEAAHGRRR